MNARIANLLLAMSIATTLGACASLGAHAPDAGRFAQIHQGITQDEVRALVGAPLYAGTNERSNETLWTYAYTDAWGYQAEFGVDFDRNTGLVTETSSERTQG